MHQSPDEVAAAAQQRVQRLEAALHTLGDEDTPEVKSLQDALKKAKVASAIDFGQFRLWPISTSANFDFGQFRLRPIFGC